MATKYEEEKRKTKMTVAEISGGGSKNNKMEVKNCKQRRIELKTVKKNRCVYATAIRGLIDPKKRL